MKIDEALKNAELADDELNQVSGGFAASYAEEETELPDVEITNEKYIKNRRHIEDR